MSEPDDSVGLKDQRHTEVKHRILEKYLSTWTSILPAANPKLHYFDGFAGPALYEGERKGSPLLALDVADRNSSNFENFHCTFNELKKDRFESLKQGVKDAQKTQSSKISSEFYNERFEDVAVQVLRENYHTPSLIFIDPFGYDSVPFDVVSEIMNLRESGDEIIFTFMVHYINRFINEDPKESAITRVFGTDEWKQYRGIDDTEKLEEKMVDLYLKQLEEVGVEYQFPFQMKRNDKNRTEYYLIHASNHFKGYKVMKDVMYREGADEEYAFLGQEQWKYDDNQKTLFDHGGGPETSREEELAEFLYEEFEGETITHWELYKQTYERTDCIETHYTTALTQLEEEDRIQRPDGNSNDAIIQFKQENQRLSDFH